MNEPSPVNQPPEYLVAHIVTALAEDPRTHQMGIDVVAHEHEVRLAGQLDSDAQRTLIFEVVTTAAPDWVIVDDLIITPAHDRNVGEEFL